MNNRDSLITLMVDQNLERREVASLLGVDRETVDHWLLPTESHRTQEMPDMALELLEMKLGVRDVETYIPEAKR